MKIILYYFFQILILWFNPCIFIISILINFIQFNYNFLQIYNIFQKKYYLKIFLSLIYIVQKLNSILLILIILFLHNL